MNTRSLEIIVFWIMMAIVFVCLTVVVVSAKSPNRQYMQYLKYNDINEAKMQCIPLDYSLAKCQQ